MFEETLTLEQAATLMNLGVDATRELIESGELPAARLNQKHTVLLREDVIDFVRAKARQQADERRKKRQERKPTGRGPRTRHADLSNYGG